MVVDFRKINEYLKCWSYPLIIIDRIFSKIYCTKLKLFSTLDFRSGYNITVVKDSQKYTDFTTEYGKYEFLHVSFSIHTASCYYALAINETIIGLDFCFAYFCDIIIYSK